jgi:hypothetical protein
MTSTLLGYILLAVAGGFVLIGNLIIQRMTSLEA